MPSSKRQRELARRRAERQAERRAAERAARKRRQRLIYVSVFSVVLLLVLGLTVGRDLLTGDGDPAAQPTPTPSPSAGGVACGGAEPPSPSPKPTFAKEPAMSIDTKKTYKATMQTSCGPISFTMFDDKAPRTVNSLNFLAGKQFYDGTFCHRMTNSPGLTVLQCGDPQGTGSGGPGYTLAEENLTGAKYTRGVVAMAKTQAPHSTGSQFFLISKDSELPPQYTVVGQMDEASLAVLDKIMAAGVEGGGTDGPPAQKVYINTFRVTAA